MLVRQGNQFKLYPHKVRYIQDGKEIEQWALPDKEWWVDFADKWEHTEIVEFTEVEITEEQLSRFEEIRYMPEDFMDVYISYILNGVFPSDFPSTHPLMLLKANKDNVVQDTILLDLDFRQSMTEMGL